jgi:hypothetical protein
MNKYTKFHKIIIKTLIISLMLSLLIIPAAAVAGAAQNASVTPTGGTGEFAIAAVPSISSFSPASGVKNTSVVIHGANFTGTTSVKFGSFRASSFTINSATQITAVVGSGSSGKITVTTPGGTATSSTDFTYYGTPTVSSFSPKSAGYGSTVTITGTNLLGATNVNFGGTPAASFVIVSKTRITAVVASGTTGKITLTTPGGTAASKSTFTFIGAPVISSFSPVSGTKGTRVIINGTDLKGATSVYFGGTKASSFKVNSSTKITAVVNKGSTGVVRVTTPGGTAASLDEFTYYFAPTISSFTPSESGSGTAVTITGTNFSGASSVKFGKTQAGSFTVISSTQISAAVSSGSTGKITVTTPGGTATSKSTYTFVPAPVITSFTPASGLAGTSVTITGKNFSRAVSVKFGDISAASYKVNSSTKITAVVGSGSTGKISVTTLGGTAISSSVFTHNAPPVITSFTPSSGAAGSDVTITGTNFIGAASVKFGGTEAASFTVNSSTEISAVVGSGSTGKISVTTPKGTSLSPSSFTFVAAPTISNFTPSSGAAGSEVTITGTNFTGATSLKFGGTEAASFTVNSGSEISAVVGSGSTGVVSVITPYGTAVSLSTFTFVPAPTISNFTPSSGTTGSEVTITGTNFSGATSVKFGGTEAGSFTVNSAVNISAFVGSGSTGVVSVTTPGGTALSSSEFTHNLPPAVTMFTPASGGIGAEVTITGTNLAGATGVKFGGTSAASFTVNSGSEISAVVGSGSSGVVSVITPNGTAVSLSTFTFMPAPTISSFTPDTGESADTVTLTGTHFTGTSSVEFGGTEAASFTVNSDTEISAVVGSGSTGKISVTTPGGTAESSTDFTYHGVPVLSTITLTDEDLPDPPFTSITLHIIEPSEGNPGTAEIQASYQTFTYGVYLGVENGQMWMSHLPQRSAVPESLRGFYDSLGITENTTYTDDKYWFTGFPDWMNIEERDPDLVGMPVMESISSTDGQMIITYWGN